MMRRKTSHTGPRGRRAAEPEQAELAPIASDQVPAAVETVLADPGPAAAAELARPAVAMTPPLDPLREFFVSETERDGVAQSYVGDAETRAVTTHRVLELLAFWAADEEYAVEIVAIQEIIKVPVLTEVPRAGGAFLGIISLRGTIVPICDLRALLHLPGRPLTSLSRILVMRGRGEPVGLLVDQVSSVVRLDEEAVEQVPRTMQREGSELLKGVGRAADRILIVLDLDALWSGLEAGA